MTPDGSVWTWGSNAAGQLGDGTNTSRAVPAIVPLLSDVTAVAAGAHHTLALKGDGSLWSWGANTFGALGDGTTSNRNAPVAVSGLSNVIAIAAGEYHSVAVTSDGHVWTWGRNNNGQLGDGTTNLSTQPLVVSTTIVVTAIGAGANHTLIVKSDGTVWGWGANGNGQLGDGFTATPRTSPVQMTGVTGAYQVAGGDAHSLVLKTDGTVRAAGYNTYGQLGDGTSTQRTSPVVVPGLTTVSAIASFTYDANGNLTAQGSKTYEWNARDELMSVLEGATELARFAYDGLGRRTEKTAGGVTRYFVYSGEDILEERVGSDVQRHVHGPGIDQPLATVTGSSVQYYLADHLGSIVQVTNAAAQVELTRQYDPYGRMLVGETASGYAFTGREWDAETGLYHYRARYYDARLGRFISEDPIGVAGGINLQAYVVNNPIIFVDPFGLHTLIFDGKGVSITDDNGRFQGYIPATSGRDGSTDTSARNKGPFPRRLISQALNRRELT